MRNPTQKHMSHNVQMFPTWPTTEACAFAETYGAQLTAYDVHPLEAM